MHRSVTYSISGKGKLYADQRLEGGSQRSTPQLTWAGAVCAVLHRPTSCTVNPVLDCRINSGSSLLVLLILSGFGLVLRGNKSFSHKRPSWTELFSSEKIRYMLSGQKGRVSFNRLTLLSLPWEKSTRAPFDAAQIPVILQDTGFTHSLHSSSYSILF